LGKLRRRITYANVLATACLFIVLGGTGFAAVALTRDSVRSKHIKNGNVKRADLAANAVNTFKVRNRSLRARDFAAGQLPARARGPAGPRGQDGPQGEPGTDGAPATKLFAYVAFNAPSTYTLDYGSGATAVLNAEIPTSTVDVRFNRAVQGCVAQATPGVSSPPLTDDVDRSALISLLLDPDNAAGAGDDIVRVIMRHSNNTAANTSFLVTLFC
jgi:hypothetical protein